MGFCLRHGFTPRVAQEANQTHTVIGLAGVAYRAMREATPESRTAVAWRRGDASPVVAAFLGVARRAAKQVHSSAEEP